MRNERPWWPVLAMLLLNVVMHFPIERTSQNIFLWVGLSHFTCFHCQHQWDSGVWLWWWCFTWLAWFLAADRRVVSYLIFFEFDLSPNSSIYLNCIFNFNFHVLLWLWYCSCNIIFWASWMNEKVSVCNCWITISHSCLSWVTTCFATIL